MGGGVAFKSMRLRYPGTCVGCRAALPAGQRAHYLPPTKTIRCLTCGPPAAPASTTSADPPPPPAPTSVAPPSTPPPPEPAPHPPSTPPTFVSWPDPVAPPAGTTPSGPELVEGPLPRATTCGDCGRKLGRGAGAVHSADLTDVLCLECVDLTTMHSLGTPGAGARREHAKRLDRHQTRVRAAHPRLGGLILALADDPQHVRAWQTGAAGEEAFGRRLSSVSGPSLKVLHDRKLPRSAANIDHLAITTETVWVLDAKRYKGRVETRGGGLFSSRPPELYVGGRNQTKLVAGVRRQTTAVEGVLATIQQELGLPRLPDVRGALVFTNAEFGLFSSPFGVDGVWVGWGKAACERLVEETGGMLPVDAIAKRLACRLRAGA
jgi:hypothetical protein